jgi:hypothetical protein
MIFSSLFLMKVNKWIVMVVLLTIVFGLLEIFDGINDRLV